jgi:hypothetical protein
VDENEDECDITQTDEFILTHYSSLNSGSIHSVEENNEFNGFDLGVNYDWGHRTTVRSLALQSIMPIQYDNRFSLGL